MAAGWGAERWSWAYGAAACAVAALGVGQVLSAPPAPGRALALVATAVAAVGVALLPRRLLTAVAGIVVAVAVAQLAPGDAPFATFLATLLAVYTLARYAEGLRLLVGYGMVLLAVAAFSVQQIATGQDSAFGAVILAVYLGVVTLIGALARQRAGYARAVAERAAALEREHEHLAELAAAAERARLARELHDGIAHGVSLMSLQAEAAREVLDAAPERAARALDAIGDTGRRTVADLHRMLGLLQDASPDRASGRDDARLLDDVHELAEPLRQAGIDVRVVEAGEPRPLPADLRSALHRILQESMTNVIKHAAAPAVTVRLTYEPGAFRLEVADDDHATAGWGQSVRGASPGAGGRGISGMKVRATEAGGTLTAGPRPDGGFAVQAAFPTHATTDSRE